METFENPEQCDINILALYLYHIHNNTYLHRVATYRGIYVALTLDASIMRAQN